MRSLVPCGDGAEWVSPRRFHELLAKAHIRLSVNSAMFERELLLEMGPFDPALRWHSDWFAIYAAAFRHGFCACPAPCHGSVWRRLLFVQGAAIRRSSVIEALYTKLARGNLRMYEVP